jgi:hypothetical protein
VGSNPARAGQASNRQRHCIADLDDYSCAVVKWLANGGEVMVATTPFIDGDLVAIGDED